MPELRRTRAAHPRQKELQALLTELTAIQATMVEEAAASQSLLDDVHPNYRASARNLLHYLALRRQDLRSLQLRLAALGLSSLGRAESHVLPAIDAVLDTLARLSGSVPLSGIERESAGRFSQGAEQLTTHTACLLGPPTPGRGVRIMVTMPTEAAHDYSLIHSLLEHGMDCMRINCVRDDAAAWLRMIEHLRRAEQALGRSCRVMMDLGGPKLRTGPVEAGPAVVRIRPRRDAFGRVTAPARIWLSVQDKMHPPPSMADAILPVAKPWLARLRKGQHIHFVDTREGWQTMTIADVTAHGCWAEMDKTAYVVPGTILCGPSGKKGDRDHGTPVGQLPAREQAITLRIGDQLVLDRDIAAGRPATFDSAGNLLTPSTIGCTLAEIFSSVRAGEGIWFDDGRIGGVIEWVEEHQIGVRISHARPGGGKLRGDKGINLPESKLELAALTIKDIEDLRFVSRHADLVGLSFVNSAQDVELLHEHLAELEGRQPAVVLKIETRSGFENLPAMLLTAMQAPCCGVMIARGDLAVECGFERLAEVQEEILWICEAAHVPVIWAAQVLESLAKEGLPSRAEITDAAMGHRAECVMLNKGPHIATAVQVLDGILRRMQAHQDKKRSMLRALRLAQSLPAA